jgi:hypothetical protein
MKTMETSDQWKWEEKARPISFCLGCGNNKDQGTIVCWNCFKHSEDCLKESGKSFRLWLSDRYAQLPIHQLMTIGQRLTEVADPLLNDFQWMVNNHLDAKQNPKVDHIVNPTYPCACTIEFMGKAASIKYCAMHQAAPELRAAVGELFKHPHITAYIPYAPNDPAFLKLAKAWKAAHGEAVAA